MVKFTTEAFVLIVSLCSQLSFAAAEIRITDGALAQKAFVPTSGAKERLLNFSLVFSVDCRRQHWLRSAYDDPPDKTKLSKKSSADTQRIQKPGVVLKMNLAGGLPGMLSHRIQQQMILSLMMNGIEAMNTITDRPQAMLIRSSL